MPNLNTIDPRTRNQLFAWYSAKWVNGIGAADPADAATIAQWNDLGPGARHLVQATEANKPTFRKNAFQTTESYPAVRFADATDIMSAAIAGAQVRPITVLGVWINYLADDALLHNIITFNANRIGLSIDWLTNNEFGALDDAAIQSGAGDVAGTTSLIHVQGFVAQPSGSSVTSVDGINKYPSGLAGTNTDKNINVGTFNADVCEVQVYLDAMPLAELDARLKSLAQDWGMLFRYQLQK